MSFYINVGYKFPSTSSIPSEGGLILCSAMPLHQLVRRRPQKNKFLSKRVFDPQLYLAGLDPAQSPKHCTTLSSYPWFGVKGLKTFDSSEQTQASWRKESNSNIQQIWPRNPPSDPNVISKAVKECIDFQIKLGCECVIIPSPLTSDPVANYGNELIWIDAATDYVAELRDFHTPLFATVAIADICGRYTNPLQNSFLDLVSDAVSARKLDGVYIVLEQGSESLETRHCSNSRVLASVLRLVHLFSINAGLRVIVNFMGMFGLVCESVGASMWADGWYKSLHRLRLADKLAGGRSYPSYWSFPTSLDIHLENDFDNLVSAGLLPSIQDITSASEGLIRAAAAGRSANSVPAWNYRQSNITSASEHYLLSCIAAETTLSKLSEKERLDFTEEWLRVAENKALLIERTLGSSGKTNTRHVTAWREAFRLFRQDHNV